MIYQYTCSTCNNEYEHICSVSEHTNDITCSNCGRKMSRIWNSPAIKMGNTDDKRHVGKYQGNVVAMGNDKYKPKATKNYEITNDDLNRIGIY